VNQVCSVYPGLILCEKVFRRKYDVVTVSPRQVKLSRLPRLRVVIEVRSFDVDLLAKLWPDVLGSKSFCIFKEVALDKIIELCIKNAIG
jgi:hypothetical protein